jgi:adenylate cyclase
MMDAWLVQISPRAEYDLSGNGTVIGRGTRAEVRLGDPSISREHARVLNQGGVWHIRDLGSANGTLVNQMPVRGMCRLKNGDRLRLGNCEFLFQCTPEATTRDQSQSGATLLNQPETRQVVLLVADLKGFTHLSSRLSPADLAAAVCFWCDECRRILEQHGAVLDKFIGDCAFAWWPGSSAVNREHALQAARALLEIVPPPGLVMECGVALHRGEVALCRLPDSTFTLLGSEVNTTFRLESLTRLLGHPLLVSARFCEDWSAPPSRFSNCGDHPLKGLPEPLRVFAVLPDER